MTTGEHLGYFRSNQHYWISSLAEEMDPSSIIISFSEKQPEDSALRCLIARVCTCIAVTGRLWQARSSATKVILGLELDLLASALIITVCSKILYD